MLERIRQYFIFDESTYKLYVLALITGLLASGVIIAFRLFIDLSQIALFPTHQAESFADLPWYWILSLPIIGGLVIGLMLHGLKPEERSTGVVHVIERLSYHEGRLPLTNFLRQFFGAGIALITGHSVGREGPSVHLGAASGSQIGMLLDLPNNSVRILLASGTAAAIAASFNTPIAGVIFAIEVVMMEYYIASFIPIILASVTGAVLSRLVFGESAIFEHFASEMQSLWELPYIVLMGIVIGGLAAVFIRSVTFFSTRFNTIPFWLRTTAAGGLVGITGLLIPEVMGMSYLTIGQISVETMLLSSLIALMIAKLFLSTACVGLGIPGGLIGPTIVVGACAGAAMGIIGGSIFPDYASSMTFYAVLGLCAMMGATLKAPLAALMAMLELTANPSAILPGMLVIIAASMVTHDFFKAEPLFLKLLRARGLDVKNDPITQTLRRISVAKAMQRSFVEMGRYIHPDAALTALSDNPEWILIKMRDHPVQLMPASDLAHALNADELEEELDLLKIPAARRHAVALSLHSNLHQAAEAFGKESVEALYITRITAPTIERTYGILLPEHIESHYQLPYTLKAKTQ